MIVTNGNKTMKHEDVRTEATQDDCRLCAILRDGSAVDAFESVWLGGDEYKALISVGAMVPGWTLVCPIEHEVNLTDHYSKSRFQDFVRKAHTHLQRRYGRCVVFEHGARREDSLTGCGVGHAHLHLVPLSFPLSLEALRSAPELDWRPCVMAQVQDLAAGGEYLFVADEYEGPTTAGLLARLDTPTSQFFRRVIAGRLGLPEFFDYKKYPMLDIARSSAEELRAVVTASAGA